jgi:hypothetical protein
MMARAPTYLVPVILLGGGEVSPLGDKKRGAAISTKDFLGKESAKFATFLGEFFC